MMRPKNFSGEGTVVGLRNVRNQGRNEMRIGRGGCNGLGRSRAQGCRVLGRLRCRQRKPATCHTEMRVESISPLIERAKV